MKRFQLLPVKANPLIFKKESFQCSMLISLERNLDIWRLLRSHFNSAFKLYGQYSNLKKIGIMFQSLIALNKIEEKYISYFGTTQIKRLHFECIHGVFLALVVCLIIDIYHRYKLMYNVANINMIYFT